MYRVQDVLLAHGKVIAKKKTNYVSYTGYKVKLNKTLIGYKSARYIDKDGRRQKAIISLMIPRGATVIKGTEYNTKLRTNKAKVINVVSMARGRVKKAFSMHDHNFKYKSGQNLKPSGFDPSYKTCASGIHFFIDRGTAKNYGH